MTEAEKDLNLKLRSMRFLWYLGFLTRRNVDVVRYVEGHRDTVYTDIDVMGVKLNPDLTVSRVLADCTTSSASTPQKILWLSGLTKLTGSEYGLLSRDVKLGMKYSDLARSTGMIMISPTTLDSLEQSYKIPKDRFFGSFHLPTETSTEPFRTLKEASKEAYEYLLFRHWWDPPHQQILTIASICRRIVGNEISCGKWTDFLCSYGLTSIGIAVCEIAGGILTVPEDKRQEEIVTELLGGRLQAYERRKLLATLYDFMTKEIQERYHEKYPVSRKQFVENIVPEYSKYLADLVLRICDDPLSSLFMPRVLDLFSHEVILYGGELRIGDVVCGFSDRHPREILKPAKDALDFGIRSGIITKGLLGKYTQTTANS